jgi:hypothetical protein
VSSAAGVAVDIFFPVRPADKERGGASEPRRAATQGGAAGAVAHPPMTGIAST